MASAPKFINPATMPGAVARTVSPIDKDIEAGEGGIEPPKEPVKVNIVEKKDDPLFKSAAVYGLRGKGKKKTRKQKKRAQKKTQKRRGRK